MGAGGFSCCEPKQFVQDKMCTNFTVSGIAADSAEILYATNANDVIFASGTIKNTGNFPISVQFVKGGDSINTPRWPSSDKQLYQVEAPLLLQFHTSIQLVHSPLWLHKLYQLLVNSVLLLVMKSVNRFLIYSR